VAWLQVYRRAEKSALRVELNYTRRENIEKMKEKLEFLGLRESEHFTVTWLGEEKIGHLRLLKEGIIELAYVAKHGPEPQRLEAAELLNHLRRRAEVKGVEVLEKLEELIRKGEEKGVAGLVGRTFEMELEAGNRNIKAEAVIRGVKSWIEENEKRAKKKQTSHRDRGRNKRQRHSRENASNVEDDILPP
jgi:hypothetical protein